VIEEGARLLREGGVVSSSVKEIYPDRVSEGGGVAQLPVIASFHPYIRMERRMDCFYEWKG